MEFTSGEHKLATIPCALILVFQCNLAPLTIIHTGDELFYCDNNRIVINLVCNITVIGSTCIKYFISHIASN